jgi:hypothetical protein
MLVLAPLTALAAALVHPPETADATHQLAITAASLNRWYLAHLLYLIAFALFVPAVLSLGRRLRDTAPGLELWGTALAVVGLFSSAGIVAVEGFGGWQLAQAADRAGAADTLSRIGHSAGIVIPLGIVGLTFSAGLIVLAVGLHRRGAVAPWMPGALVAGAVLLAVGLAGEVKPALVLGLALLAAAMVSIGLADLGVARTVTARSTRHLPGAPSPAAS